MSITLLSGDCRDVLPTLAANSVHCVVTSPPYYGLRDYGTAQWDGGDAECDHADTSFGKGRGAGVWFDGGKPRELEGGRPQPGRSCARCGARRVDRQIGLEATPDEYLATMVAVFREVRRVLRPDGTLWLNVGDSFCSGTSAPRKATTTVGDEVPASWASRSQPERTTGGGLAAKQLLMMPARLALALQADGWWVRSDIIWHKPNPMPESVTDRPTSAHEHVFLLTRSPRYFYDAEAVREPHEEPWRSTGKLEHLNATASDDMVRMGFPPGKRPREYNPAGRNCRNVWTIATSPYSEAHFATFPPALAERCIRAGASERGCCAACGAPWRREVEHGAAVPLTPSDAGRKATWTIGDASRDPASRVDTPLPRHYRPATTTGWTASCACAADVVPATVLDPFAGAGTTLLVADRLQRNAIGIELNAAYTTMAMDRCRADAPLFADTPEPQPVPGFAQPDLFAEAAD